MKPIKIAILDLYCNHPNQGMRCIKNIIDEQIYPLQWDVYDARAKNEFPEEDYDIYISTGGPGDPVHDNGAWEKNYLSLSDKIFDNNVNDKKEKKYAFFICHSFQVLSHHLKIAEVTKRKSTAFGIFPVHITEAGKKDPILKDLPEPFYAVDSRDWQVIQPDEKRIKKIGAEVLALEKIRPHVNLERAVMAIRFSNEIIGTQFHPEADVIGMDFYFKREDKKKQIIENHGEQKYNDMIAHLNDKDKIFLTHNTILPLFLKNAVQELRRVE
jgi:GMP synthase-like glutamine amidotransferase